MIILIAFLIELQLISPVSTEVGHVWVGARGSDKGFRVDYEWSDDFNTLYMKDERNDGNIDIEDFDFADFYTDNNPPEKVENRGSDSQSPWVEADRVKFPFVARVNRVGLFVCGGTLLSRKWVLTAARCVMDGIASDYSVTLGDFKLNNKTQQAQTIPIRNVYIHHDFDDMTSDTDIALLKLDTPAKMFRRRVQQLKNVLSKSLKNQAFRQMVRCAIVGWGQSRENGELAEASRLGYKRVKTQRGKPCERETNQTVFEGQFCTDGRNKDMCMNKAGSAIVCQNENNRQWLQLGLVLNDTCDGTPNVAVDVSQYRKWIQDVMSGNIPSKCNWNEFMCEPTDQCIPEDNICDGKIDCNGTIADETDVSCDACNSTWRIVHELNWSNVTLLAKTLAAGDELKALWEDRSISFTEVRLFNESGEELIVGKQIEIDFRKVNMITVDTTGNVTITTLPLYNNNPASITLNSSSLTWFARSQLPLLSGSPTKIMAKQGAGFFIVSRIPSGIDLPETMFSLKPSFTKMAEESVEIAVRRMDSVYLANASSINYGFISFESTGLFNSILWDVTKNEPVNEILSNETGNFDWFVDPCWKLIYSHNRNGQATAGSLRSLRKSIRSGNKVKVVIKRKAYEPHIVRIRNGQVSAQGVRLSEDSLGDFAADLRLIYIETSTTGRVQQVSFNFGVFNSSKETNVTRAMSWFVHIPSWTKTARYNFKQNNLTEGLFADLRNALNNGNDARLSIDIDDYEVFFDIGRFNGNFSANAFGLNTVPSGDSEFTWSKTPDFTWYNLLVTESSTVEARIEVIALDGVSYNTTSLSTGGKSIRVDVFTCCDNVL